MLFHSISIFHTFFELEWSGASKLTTARPIVPVAPVMIIFIKYTPLFI